MSQQDENTPSLRKKINIMILIFKIKKSIYHQKLGQSLRMAENLNVKPCRQLSEEVVKNRRRLRTYEQTKRKG